MYVYLHNYIPISPEISVREPCCLSVGSVTIEVIQVDSSGEPLSIGQTLGNLERAAQEIRRSGVFPGAQVGSVSAVVPSEWSILKL